MIYDGASSLLINDGRAVVITHQRLTHFWQCPKFFFFYPLYNIRRPYFF